MRPLRTLLVASFLIPAAAAARDRVANGVYRGQTVTYQIVHGAKLFQGDILLDHVTSPPNRNSRSRPPGFGVAYGQYLWPTDPQGVAEIPYIITNPATQLSAALTAFNTTFNGIIQFVTYNNQTDYVNFDFDSNNLSGQCESYVGRIGGEQNMGGSVSCDLGTLLHEMGHVVGLYHEMTRPDRKTYITLNFANVIKGSEGNFQTFSDNNQELGLFDYASVMMYIPFAFSRNGGPVLDTVPPGMPLSNLIGYSAGDIDSVDRLYGAAPKQVTITSNPPGLSVVVDGNAVVTPQSYTWSLRSTHTIAVQPGAQTLTTGPNPGTYIYGTWNDNPAASHTIINRPGDKTLVQPATSPAVTVYTANFVQLSPYTSTIVPTGAGTVAVSPAPQSYQGAQGQFLVARQPVTLTPSPIGSTKFITWGGTSAPFSANPKPDYVPDGALPYAVTAYFSSKPITTITTTPGGFWFTVDGNYYKAPQNFTADLFNGWGPGSTHTVTAYSPSQPYSVNTRYLFDSWSDNGAISHQITLPKGASRLTAKFTAQYLPIAYAQPYCAATVTITPSSPDGFYNSGTLISVASQSTAGLTFDGWTGDRVGMQNPLSLTVNSEELVLSNYNTSGTMFTLAGLTPKMFARGSAGGTVKITGTGFTSGSAVFVNNSYRASTYVSPTEVDVALNSGDLTTAGAFPIGVSNYPAGGNCGNYGAKPLFVTTP
jgi:hypothetical protein